MTLDGVASYATYWPCMAKILIPLQFANDYLKTMCGVAKIFVSVMQFLESGGWFGWR